MRPGNNFTKILVAFLFVVLSVFSIARFLSQLVLNPDSTGYITAAQNFIRTGYMFAYANSPSWSLEPAIEPYTEQPSGFPLYLVPFLLVIKQPVIASAAAQSLAILIFYAAVYTLTLDLGAGPFFQVVCALIFTLFRPIQTVFSNVESETLFIAMSLWTVHFLVSTKFSRNPSLSWIAALLCAAAASLTRSVGVLMLPVFILVCWQSQKSRWISIGLSILAVAGPVVAWALRNQVLYGYTSATHTVENQIALEKLFPQLLYIIDSVSRQAWVVLLVVLFSAICLAAPVIGPFHAETCAIRPKMVIPKRPVINILVTILGLMIAVIAIAADRLGFGGDPEIGLKQLAVVCGGIILVIAPWLRNTNLLEYLSSWRTNYDWNRWRTRPMYTFSLLLFAGLSHFVGITALSLITPFSDLQDRLLSPSLALLLFSGLAGMYYLTTLLPRKLYSVPIYGIAFGLIILSPYFITTGLPFQLRINRPPEQELWSEIYALPGINKASHYYTDYDFTHEIFGNRPQRIILDEENIAEPGFLTGIMSTGQCPFIIVNHGNRMSELMNQHYQEAGLIRLEMMNGQFELFVQPCLLSP